MTSAMVLSLSAQLHQSRTRRAAGFTLIETLAAVALSALLTFAILGTVAALGREAQTGAKVEQRVSASRSAGDIVELLRSDLAAAQRWKTNSGRVTLAGFGGLAPGDLSPSHRPARIVYRIEDVAGLPCLFRDQAMLDVASNRNTTTELVCAGVRRFSLSPASALEPTDSPEPAAPPTGALPAVAPSATRPASPAGPTDEDFFGPDEGQRVPDAIDLQLEIDAPAGWRLNRILCLR